LQIDARQLAEAREAPLCGRDVHHRDALPGPRPDDAARHAQMHIGRTAAQRHGLAGAHAEPLLRGGREEDGVAGEGVERAAAVRHTRQIGRDAARAEHVDAEHFQRRGAIRHGHVEFEHGAGERDAGLCRESWIGAFIERGLCAAHLQVSLARQAARRRREFVERGAVDQLHGVAECDAERDGRNRDQGAAFVAVPLGG